MRHVHSCAGCLLRTLAVLLVLTSGQAAAQGVIFRSGMEAPRLDPLFPIVNGQAQLSSGPATDKLLWFLSQLAPGENPTDQEILLHFDDAWLASIDVQQTRNFILAVQADYPNARVIDVVGLTPMQFTGLIRGDTGNEAFVILSSRFAEPGIFQLGVNAFGTGGGSVVFPVDRNLTLVQAADKFATLSAQPALFVGRIDANDQCVPIIERNGSALRATASVFKIWVLGGVAEAIGLGLLFADQLVPRVDAKRAPGGPIIDEPDGTPFTVAELAELMLGISDNTATDLLHDVAGRDRLNAIVSTFGHASPQALTPFLNISETFHLLFSFSLSEAQGYLDADEPTQAQFVVDEIEPLGTFADGPGGFNNISLFTTGTWRASPIDVCRALAAHRRWANGSDQAVMADRALGAQAAQPNVRNAWDRVWYKGGNLIGDVGNNGSFEQVVLTHAWLLEDSGDDPYVVVALSNDPVANIDTFAVQSITGRILELVSAMR